MKIIVASKNPVKIQAALDGFSRMFPGQAFEVIGAPIDSGVSGQPMSDRETYQGALNRAKRAREAYPDADFSVGIEGGVEDAETGMHEVAWAVVVSREGRIGQARGATFYLPHPIAEMIRQGKELGDANDILFQRTNSKQQNGAVGILTGDVITRASYCAEAVCMALILFKNPGLYDSV